LLIASLALTAGSVTPSANNNDPVSRCQIGSLWYATPDLFHGAGNLVPGYRRKLQRKCLFEVTLNQLNVCPTHPTSLDLDENFFGTDLGGWNFFKNKWLVVAMHSRC
jgi:hypothetical protein